MDDWWVGPGSQVGWGRARGEVRQTQVVELSDMRGGGVRRGWESCFVVKPQSDIQAGFAGSCTQAVRVHTFLLFVGGGKQVHEGCGHHIYSICGVLGSMHFANVQHPGNEVTWKSQSSVMPTLINSVENPAALAALKIAMIRLPFTK